MPATGYVSLPKLTAELGISRNTRADMIRRGYVTPIYGTHRGKETLIPAADADRMRKAVAIAMATGVAILTIMCLLASGYVRPATP